MTIRESKVEAASRSNSLRKLFIPNLGIMLRFTGLDAIDTVLTNEFYKKNALETLRFIIGVIPNTTIVIFQYLSIYRYWTSDKQYVFSLCTILFEMSVVLTKGITLWTRRLELRELYENFKVSWLESVGKSMIKNDIVKAVKCGSSVCKLYMMVILNSALLWALSPYSVIAKYYINERKRNVTFDLTQTMYPIRYPITATTMKGYFLWLAYEHYYVVYGLTYWITSDLIFIMLCTHLAIQFQVLSNDLENIQPGSIVENDNKEIIKRLSTIARRHRELFVCSRKLNSIFDPILFISMISISANVCISVFQFEKELSLLNYSEAAKHIAHMIAVMVQVSVLCSYAESITTQSSQIARAAYNCSWMDQSQEFKIMILIIMIQGQKPFNMTAYAIVSVNISKITQVANSAISYFTLLKAVA